MYNIRKLQLGVETCVLNAIIQSLQVPVVRAHSFQEESCILQQGFVIFLMPVLLYSIYTILIAGCNDGILSPFYNSLRKQSQSPAAWMYCTE